MVGFDSTMLFTGRMDMTRCPFLPLVYAACAAAGRDYEREELIDEALQELPRAFVGDGAGGVDQPGLEREVGLAARDQHALRARGSGCRCCCAIAVPMAPGDAPVTAATLPVQEFWPQGRAPQSMRVLEHRRDRAAVLRRDEQDAVRRRDLGLEAGDRLRQVGFEVLVVDRQIVDLRKAEIRFRGPELRQRLRQLAVDGVAAVAADDDGDLEFCHGIVTFRYVVTNCYRG